MSSQVAGCPNVAHQRSITRFARPVVVPGAIHGYRPRLFVVIVVGRSIFRSRTASSSCGVEVSHGLIRAPPTLPAMAGPLRHRGRSTASTVRALPPTSPATASGHSGRIARRRSAPAAGGESRRATTALRRRSPGTRRRIFPIRRRRRGHRGWSCRLIEFCAPPEFDQLVPAGGTLLRPSRPEVGIVLTPSWWTVAKVAPRRRHASCRKAAFKSRVAPASQKPL